MVLNSLKRIDYFDIQVFLITTFILISNNGGHCLETVNGTQKQTFKMYFSPPCRAPFWPKLKFPPEIGSWVESTTSETTPCERPSRTWRGLREKKFDEKSFSTKFPTFGRQITTKILLLHEQWNCRSQVMSKFDGLVTSDVFLQEKNSKNPKTANKPFISWLVFY